ncbi:MAG: hypothetical protein JO257_07010 [Deltaproteobacteria bacterium]|nr:hypothetical protein [Deltaproteobacteria bacterium]
MKLASLVVIGSLAACKPSSSAKPTEGSAAPAPVVHEITHKAVEAPPVATSGSGSAHAPVRPASGLGSGLDTDGDGIVSGEERDKARIQSAMQRRGGGSGEISPDDAQQRLRELRARRRAELMNGSDE